MKLRAVFSRLLVSIFIEKRVKKRMQRIAEIDFLKGVLILLVISFHLVYIEQLYPYAKQVVYTFHMPAFLVISGFLRGKRKEPKDFIRSLVWLAVPYIVMESGYMMMAAVLPIAEHIDNLSVTVFFEKLLLHPLGPYWYLHTIILCEGICYVTAYLVHGKGQVFMLLSVLILYACSRAFGIMSFSMAIYFLIGFFLRKNNIQLIALCKSSALSVVVFVLLIAKSENLHSSTIQGLLIVYTAVCSILLLSRYLTSKARLGVQYVGRNSLSIFLFSPLFTILCKYFVPFLSFDQTGIVFWVLSLTLCVGGSLFIAWAMDRLTLSNLMFGKQIYSVEI
ncbi:MAG: acyltransferase [Prevotella sp.]|nr:acyltransferase [Prevotella sp.]